jgi:glycosyltransferase involved in cell wall biosynthesis
MRILYIVPFVPWQIKVRSFNLIPRLSRNHEIYLACISGTGPNLEQQAWQNKYCRKAIHVKHSTLRGVVQCATALPTKTPLRIAYCRSQAAQDQVRRLYDEAKPDVIYIERWRAMQFVPEDLQSPLVCDPTDSMTLYNRRLMRGGAWWERLVGWEEYIKFKSYEGKLAQRPGVCIFCSQVDVKCVKEQAPEALCELVPNGVDCQKYFLKNESEEQPGTVVFTGSFKYRPNRHAAEFFLERILPMVRREVPEATFLAVGNGARKALSGFLGTPGFEALDFVPDLRPYLAKAAVAVAPLTVGSGVSNKLGEGFAVGTPVVATSLACGDLPVTSGRELLIGETAGEFAGHVVTLLKNSGLRREMALCARRLVEEKYDWEIVSRKMESVLQDLVRMGENGKREKTFTTA